MKTKKILAMLLSAMIVMSASAVSVSAEKCPDDTCVAINVAEVPATCTSTGTTAGTKCAECGEVLSGCEEIPMIDHTWGSGEQTKVPTCSETGVKTYTCEVCGEPKTEDIAKLDHTSEVVPEVPATCTSTGTTAGTKCSVCEEVLSGCEETPKADHSFTGAFEKVGDTQHKQKCVNCEEYNAPADCDNTTESACTSCGREATGSAEPENPAEKTQIASVKLAMEDFKVGETLPPVTSDGGTGYKVSYKWLKDGKEVSNSAVIEADKYTCQITITPEENYTLGELNKVVFEGWNQTDYTMTVEDNVGTATVVIDKSEEPAPENPGSGSGSGSGSSSSSSSTTKPTVDTKAEANKISTAKAGSKVEVKIEGNTVPASYVQAALSSKATVVVDYGTYAWEISDVKTVKSVDLSINTNARYLVNQNELKALKGDNSNVIDIAHDGNLGFKGTLKYNVKKANAGKYVNLYYYNPTTKKLELQGSTKIGADGNVFLPFTHCSTYVLNITATPASGEVFEDLSAGESATVVEETLPVGNAPAATEAPAQTEAATNPATGNSAAALVAIPVAIAAAAIISKKR